MLNINAVFPPELAKPSGRAARSPPAAHLVFVKKMLKVDRNFEIMTIMCYCKTFINNTYLLTLTLLNTVLTNTKNK